MKNITVTIKTASYKTEIDVLDEFRTAEEYIKSVHANGNEVEDAEYIITEYDEDGDVVQADSKCACDVALYDCTGDGEGQEAIDTVIDEEIEAGGAAYEMLQDGYGGDVDAYKAEYKGGYTADMMADGAVRVRHAAGGEWYVEDGVIR